MSQVKEPTEVETQLHLGSTELFPLLCLFFLCYIIFLQPKHTPQKTETVLLLTVTHNRHVYKVS